MPKAVYVVHSRPSSAEQEDAFNEWYDAVHLPDVCSVPGVVGGTRYRLAGDTSMAGSLPEYLAVYSVEAEDPAQVVANIGAGVMEGRFAMSDTIQLDPLPITALYVEL